MSGEFNLGEQHFIIQIVDSNIRIFTTNQYGMPDNEITIINYDDTNDKNYISYDMDDSLKNLINNLNKSYPLLCISLQENIVITKDYQIYKIIKQNGYKIYRVPVQYNNIGNKENNDLLLEKLDMGRSITKNGFVIEKESFDLCLRDETILNSISDLQLKNTYLELINSYKNRNTDKQGGSGDVDAKVKSKRRGSGFINNILVMSLAGFTTGVVFTLIFIIIRRYLF